MLLFFCLFSLLGYACGDDDDDDDVDTGPGSDNTDRGGAPLANGGGNGPDATPEILDRDGDGVEECTDPYATNHRDEVLPEDDDCSCVYEGFERLSAEKEVVAYRNVFLEMVTATWCGPCGTAKKAINNTPGIEKARGYGGEVARLVEMYVNSSRFSDIFASPETVARGNEVFNFSGKYGVYPTTLINYVWERSYSQLGSRVKALIDSPVSPKAMIGIESHVDGNGYSALLSFRFLDFLSTNEPVRYKTFLVEGGLDEYQVGLGEYTHHNVLREEVVMAKGVIASSVALTMGGVYTRYFEHDNVPGTYDLSHCSLVVVLYQSPIDGDFPPNGAGFEYINVSSVPVGEENVW